MSDEQLKQLVAKGLSDVLRFTTNCGLRTASFQSLNIDDSFNAEKILLGRLRYVQPNKDRLGGVQPSPEGCFESSPKKLKVTLYEPPNDGLLAGLVAKYFIFMQQDDKPMENVIKDLDDWE